jgi:hypothetical protein
MTGSAEELAARLGAAKARRPAPPPPRPGRPRPTVEAWAIGGRTLTLAALGALMVLGVVFDRPARAPAAAAPEATGDRFVIAPDVLPTTADGRPLTWGALFDLYGLEDECLRRSLEATLHHPFSLDDARRYRDVAVGRRSVTVVLRAEAGGGGRP